MSNNQFVNKISLQEMKKVTWAKIITHILVLLLIFVGPELIFSLGHKVPRMMYIGPIAYIMVFYLNYYLLIDKFLFSKNRRWLFFVINILLMLGVVVGIHYLHLITKPDVMIPMEMRGKLPLPPPMMPFEHGDMPFDHHILGFLKEIPRVGILVIMSVVLSVLMKFGEKWVKWDRMEKQIAIERQENELKNLKNQLNPHFLFNTLNNIYALIPISQQKAQLAVHDLSQLLRYVLYENNREVELSKELKFVKNYIALMQLRLGSNVKLNVRINENEGINVMIAPLMFISLIENAFKHGIGISESFINIAIFVENNKVKCTVENSCFPKNANDKSGSGIGIANLKRQLSILYPNKHIFTTEIENGVYKTYLEITLNTVQ